MTKSRIIACICFASALAAAGFGVAATAELIKLYGMNVSPLKLVLQAAVVWVPVTALLIYIGVRWFRRDRPSA